MSDLGKIFIYEKNLHHLHQLIADLELHGFYTFGTNNLFALIQYAKEVKPDIMVINLPVKQTRSEEDISKIEATVCKNGCPDIYINQNISHNRMSKFHTWNFNTEDITNEQLLTIIKNTEAKKYLQ